MATAGEQAVQFVAILIAVFLTMHGAVQAEDARPAPNAKPEREICPIGWHLSGGACVASGPSSRQAFPAPANGKCPLGYVRSAGACLTPR